MKTTWFLLDAGEVDQFQPFDALPIGCILVKEGKIRSANSCFAEIVGLPKLDLVGQDLSNYLSTDILGTRQAGSKYTSQQAVFLKTSIGERLFNANINSQGSDKEESSIVTFSEINSIEQDGKVPNEADINSKETRIESFAQDLPYTELDDIESIVHQIILTSEDAYFVYDENLRLKYFNEIASQQHKDWMDFDLVNGLEFDEIYPPDSQFAFFKKLHQQVLKSSAPIKGEMTVDYKGKKAFIQCTLKSIKDESGKVIGLVGCSKDLTATKSAQIAVAKSSATLSAVLESTKDGIAAIDKDFNFIAYNRQAIEEYKKYIDVEISYGASFSDQVAPEVFAKWDKELYSKVFAGEVIKNRVVRKETNRIYDNVYTPVLDKKGEITAVLEVSRDITEQIRNNELLRLSEVKYKSLIENIPTAVVKVNVQSNVTFISPQVEEILGYTANEIIGNSITDYIVKEDKARFFNDVKVMLETKKNSFNQYRVINKAGDERRIEGTASIQESAEEGGIEFLLVFNDITEHYKAQLLLNKTEENYISLFDNMRSSIMIYDIEQKKVVDCNQAALDLHGLDKESLLNLDRTTIIPQFSPLIPGVDIHENYKDILNQLENGSRDIETQSVIRNADGEERLVDIKIVSMSESENKVYTIFDDETDLFFTNQEIKEKSSIYDALIHNSFDGIDIVRYDVIDDYFENGELIVRNKRMANIVGKDESKLFDSVDSIMEISPELQRDGTPSKERAKQTILDTIHNGASSLEYRFSVDGVCSDMEASQAMVKIDDYVYMIKNYRDISDEVKQKDIITDQLEALNAKNEEMKKYIESNLQLENFAYIASHDLKAPIRSVISFAQLLKNNVGATLEEKNAKFLDIIISASTNMQVLIDDLLSFSRINTTAVEFEEVDMHKLLKHLLIEVNQPIVEVNGEVKILKLPEMMVADASRLRQIFQNLIMNAMKFYKPGETPLVEVDYEKKHDKYIFSVKDHGIGIEPQYLREIFLMFKKLHSENKYKGTGIGLSICKKIVEQHNGDIWVESVMGEGATFYFSICKHIEPNI